MQTAMRTRGFSLIELMIAISIFVLLVVLAGPMYGEFIANTNIRNAGESMLNGVRLAQAQAVRLNLPTEFQFNGTGWVVTTDDPDNPGTPLFQEDYALTEGANQATIKETPVGVTTVTFGGLGRIEANADASASLEALDITNTIVTTSRPLRVVIANTTKGIGTKLCDPAVPSTEPQACPP
jgi:type IV fimbrial biogenesis protein FimT